MPFPSELAKLPLDHLPRALFITIGTYAWRLPGCDFGSVSRKTGAAIPTNPGLLNHMQSLVIGKPVEFSIYERAFLIDASFQFGVNNRVIIDAANFRENHGHVLMYPLDPMPALTNQEAFLKWIGIIQAYKQFLTERLRENNPRFENQKIWARGYNCSFIFSFRAWYNRFNYTLFDQGSNYYFRFTRFSDISRLQFDRATEPERRSLENAFANYRIQAIRKRNMPYEMKCDDVILEINDEEA